MANDDVTRSNLSVISSMNKSVIYMMFKEKSSIFHKYSIIKKCA